MEEIQFPTSATELVKNTPSQVAEASRTVPRDATGSTTLARPGQAASVREGKPAADAERVDEGSS